MTGASDSKRVLLYSSDGHASPRIDDFRTYLPVRFHEALEEVIADQHRDLDDRRGQMERGGTPQLQAQAEDFAARERFAIDMEYRLGMLEEFGYVGELIFPDGNVANRIPFGGRFLCGVGPRHYSTEEWTAGLEAYNRWLGENACPDRQLGVGLVGFHDPDYALEQVKGLRQAGLRGMMPIWDGVDPSFPAIYDEAFDPVWSVCANDELPIAIHPHAGRPRDFYFMVDDTAPYSAGSFTSTRATQAAMVFETEDLFWTRRALWHLIMGGVLERHPRLRVGFVELFTDWIPRSLERLDFLLDKARGRATNWESVCPRPAHEYWERQCFVGSNVWSIEEINMRGELGVQTIAYGPDFPHGPSPWRRVKPYLRSTIGAASVSESDARDMLGGNMLHIFGLDEKQFDTLVRRIGPFPEDILSADSDKNLTEYDRFVSHHPSTSVG